MKQSEMLAALKDLRSELLRYAAGSDSIVPGAYAEALDAAIETLDRIRWISVKDRLPRYNRYVLTFTPTMAIPIVVDQYCGYWGDDDDEWYEGWWSKRKITHWMPLPELPEGES